MQKIHVELLCISSPLAEKIKMQNLVFSLLNKKHLCVQESHESFVPLLDFLTVTKEIGHAFNFSRQTVPL